jgi:hypothetical protein
MGRGSIARIGVGLRGRVDPAAIAYGIAMGSKATSVKTAAPMIVSARSIERSERFCDNLIIVENGTDAADELRRAVPQAEVLALPRNLGFSGGANAGIRRAMDAGAALVMLLNSDAEVRPDAVDVMEQALSDDGVGVVGPAIVQYSQPDVVECLGIDYSPATGRMRMRGWNGRLSPSPRPTVRVTAVSGCAMLIRRESP